MATSIYDNVVPSLWAEVAYPSLKPLSAWMTDLLARLAFIRGWIETGLPTVYWISGFFFPQAFLTGTLQNFARSEEVPIDTISFDFEVLDVDPETITTPPASGCYVRGLFLEGARWDPAQHSLAESRPKELYTDFPVVWLKPVANRDPNSGTGRYLCPVYKTLDRAGELSTTGLSTNFVISIEIPSHVPEEHWIQRGAALFCALDY